MQPVEAWGMGLRSSLSQGECVDRARGREATFEGDRVADLYDAHAAQVFHYLLALVGNRAEAEDVLQAVFLELLRRPETLTDVHSPRTYLLAMARNAVYRARQRSARQRLAEKEAGEARLLRANDPALRDADDAAQMEKAILALPEEQREVLVLKVFEQLTFREIAIVMSIPENTAASRYRYALERLRESCNARAGS